MESMFKPGSYMYYIILTHLIYKIYIWSILNSSNVKPKRKRKDSIDTNDKILINKKRKIIKKFKKRKRSEIE